jgi:rod shape-determining protein MreC
MHNTSTSSNPQLLLQFMLFVLLSLSFMVLDYKNNSITSVRTALSILVYPLQMLVDLPQEAVYRVSEFFSTHNTLSTENQAFRKQLEFSAAQQNLFQSLKTENENLRRQLQAKPNNYNKFSLADILSITRGSFKQELVINAGKDHDVTIGQPVLSLGNIYGQIIEISPYTSVVIQLSDPHHTIPVYNKRTGQSALATGTGELNMLKLKDVVANADVRNNDVYMSSGFGQLFPANYPVAKVVEVKFEPDNPFLNVKAKTFVNYDTVREVLLVWKEKVIMPPVPDESQEIQSPSENKDKEKKNNG